MRCAVLGSPIEHSLSPALHRAAYAEFGLDWRYDAVEVGEADLARFVAALDADWRGLSLTMPLKRAVIELLDSADPLVEATGVANTVVVNQGALAGFNTDIPGAARAIRERWAEPLESAVILGGGATAASLGWALADAGCTTISVVVRNQAHAAETVAVIGRHPAGPRLRVSDLTSWRGSESHILASTIPVAAQTSELLERAENAGASVVFDVIYDPWPTPLSVWATQSGRSVVSGLDLLVHQAALQVELMTGRVPSIEGMRQAGLAELAARARQ